MPELISVAERYKGWCRLLVASLRLRFTVSRDEEKSE